MNKYLIDQNKSKRTPIRTFTTLMAHGKFDEIYIIIAKKFNTAYNILMRAIIGLASTIPFSRNFIKKRSVNSILSNFYGYQNRTNKKSLKVAIIAPGGNTSPKSSTFIRLISPLTDPKFSNELSLSLLPENTVNIQRDVDIFIVQRTAYDSINKASAFVEKLRINSAKLIIDSDDSFRNINSEHPEFEQHSKRIEAYNYLLNEADRIWFSTKRLADSYPELLHKSSVIRNSLDNRLWRIKTNKTYNTGPLKIVYMGTATHDTDFEMILPALKVVAKKFPNSFELHLIGVADKLYSEPWIKRFVPENGSIYPKFVNWFIKSDTYEIGLSPLVNTTFNKHKSDIKCLDYMAVGAVPLVSDITPYRLSELDDIIIRVKNTRKDWENTLIDLVKNPVETRKMLKRMSLDGQVYLLKSRLSSQISEKVFSELKSIY